MPLGSQSKQPKPDGAFKDPSDLSYGFVIKEIRLDGASIDSFVRVTDPWMNYMIEALMEEKGKALESQANNS